MEFQGNISVCFCCLICTEGMERGHMQSMWDSGMTFSKFFDVDYPFDAEGNAFVERRNCTFRLLLSASSSFSVIFPINVDSCDSGIRCYTTSHTFFTGKV